MITGVIRYQNGTLVVEFPCGSYDLSGHLGSSAVQSRRKTEIRTRTSRQQSTPYLHRLR